LLILLEKFAKLKQDYLKESIPKSLLDDIHEDMKFAKKIEFFSSKSPSFHFFLLTYFLFLLHEHKIITLEMQALDILEETLFLIFSVHFKGQEVYPQGLAYICCPILYLLLKGIILCT
jgi:hypothetical protein